jgi:hypothetical protein
VDGVSPPKRYPGDRHTLFILLWHFCTQNHTFYLSIDPQSKLKKVYACPQITVAAPSVADLEVKAVKVHDLIPRFCEISQKFLSAI